MLHRRTYEQAHSKYQHHVNNRVPQLAGKRDVQLLRAQRPAVDDQPVGLPPPRYVVQTVAISRKYITDWPIFRGVIHHFRCRLSYWRGNRHTCSGTINSLMKSPADSTERIHSLFKQQSMKPIGCVECLHDVPLRRLSI